MSDTPSQPVKPNLPLFIVFVVESNVLCTKQTLLKEDGSPIMIQDGFVQEQFALVLGNGFEELTRLTSIW